MSSQTKIIAVVGGLLIAGAGVLFWYSGKPPAGQSDQTGQSQTRGYAPKK